MTRFIRMGAMAAFITLAAQQALPAQAASIASTLTAATGEGTFDKSLLCGSGDGQSWRYAYTGPVTPASNPLAGGWRSSIEVHQSNPAGGAMRAYIPAGTGRIHVAVARGGTATLAFSGGTCGTGALNLTKNASGDTANVTGTLPFSVTEGTGVLRSVTGSGSLDLDLTMGPGGSNPATVNLAGSLTALAPKVQVQSVSGRYANVRDYLARRLTVNFLLANDGPPATVGDAFNVTLNSASVGGMAASGTPAFIERINAGTTALVSVIVSGAIPLLSYDVSAQVSATDALDATTTVPVFHGSLMAPLLPELVL